MTQMLKRMRDAVQLRAQRNIVPWDGRPFKNGLKILEM